MHKLFAALRAKTLEQWSDVLVRVSAYCIVLLFIAAGAAEFERLSGISEWLWLLVGAIAVAVWEDGTRQHEGRRARGRARGIAEQVWTENLDATRAEMRTALCRDMREATGLLALGDVQEANALAARWGVELVIKRHKQAGN